MFDLFSTVLDPKKSKAKAKYLEARAIVHDDSFNTFQFVANCLTTIISGMNEKGAWDPAIKTNNSVLAQVCRGNIELVELYREQLASEGLIMSPVQKI